MSVHVLPVVLDCSPAVAALMNAPCSADAEGDCTVERPACAVHREADRRFCEENAAR